MESMEKMAPSDYDLQKQNITGIVNSWHNKYNLNFQNGFELLLLMIILNNHTT